MDTPFLVRKRLSYMGAVGLLAWLLIYCGVVLPKPFYFLKPFYLSLGTVRVHSLEFLDHPGLAMIPARPSRLSWSTTRLRQLGLHYCCVTSCSDCAAWQTICIFGLNMEWVVSISCQCLHFLGWILVASISLNMGGISWTSCDWIQLRFAKMSNEEHIGDLVESLLVLENEKLMSQSQAILNGCAVWTPSPPFRAFLEQFVLAVERFTIETKHINLGFVTLFFLQHFSDWRFGTIFIFPYNNIGNNHPNSLIFVREVEMTKWPNKFLHHILIVCCQTCLCYFCVLEPLFLAVKVHGWHDITKIAELSQERANLFDW